MKPKTSIQAYRHQADADTKGYLFAREYVKAKLQGPRPFAAHLKFSGARLDFVLLLLELYRPGAGAVYTTLTGGQTTCLFTLRL
jgi:hypothetical protein